MNSLIEGTPQKRGLIGWKARKIALFQIFISKYIDAGALGATNERFLFRW